MKAIPKSVTINYNGVLYAPGEEFSITKNDVSHLSKFCEIIEDKKHTRQVETVESEAEDPIVVPKARGGRSKKASE